MKVLIITMTLGEGHNSIARALKSNLESKGVETRTIEQYGYDEKVTAKDNRNYLNSCKYIPRSYNLLWNFLCKKNPNTRYKNLLQKSIKKATPFILQHIEDFKPDAILCSTHYGAAAVCNLRRQNKISNDVKLYSVLFDYCLCPYWESSILVDNIFTPYEGVNDALLKKGFNLNQIVCTGFPVKDIFSVEIPKQKAREMVKVDKDKFTVMVMSGGNGLGNTLKLMKVLSKVNHEIQIVCINGKNEKQKNKIQNFINKNNITNIYNLGYTTNVDEFMSASDCIFSRAGGVSVTESINKRLPAIFREGLINNELINKKLLIKMGISLGINKISDAKKVVNNLVENPDILINMKKNMEKLRKPNATNEISNYVINNIKK